jgi:hypothetical protein
LKGVEGADRCVRIGKGSRRCWLVRCLGRDSPPPPIELKYKRQGEEEEEEEEEEEDDDDDDFTT